MYGKIKVITDYNDGDYITSVYDITSNDLLKFLPLMKAINDFEPYPFKLGIEYSNFILGDLSQPDRLGTKTPYVSYSQFSKEHIDEFISLFLRYNLSDIGIHTIVEISNELTGEVYLRSSSPDKYLKTNDNIKSFQIAGEKLSREWADLCGCPVNEVNSFPFSKMSKEAYLKYIEYENLWRNFRDDLE